MELNKIELSLKVSKLISIIIVLIMILTVVFSKYLLLGIESFVFLVVLYIRQRLINKILESKSGMNYREILELYKSRGIRSL